MSTTKLIGVVRSAASHADELDASHSSLHKDMLRLIAGRLEKLDKLVETIRWCDENDEPVSGYIMDALAALEKGE